MAKKVKKTKKSAKSGKKILLIAISLVLVLAIAAGTVVFVKYKEMTDPSNMIEDTNKYDFDDDETVPETLASDEYFEMIYEETAASG